MIRVFALSFDFSNKRLWVVVDLKSRYYRNSLNEWMKGLKSRYINNMNEWTTRTEVDSEYSHCEMAAYYRGVVLQVANKMRYSRKQTALIGF